jgi:hypothetical protein
VVSANALTIVDAIATLHRSSSIFMEGNLMLGRLFQRRVSGVKFCDACASVCDARCRSDAVVDQARTRALAARGVLW